MKKYCDGVGVFDTNDARAYEVGPHSVTFELDAGETWVLDIFRYGSHSLKKLDYAKAATMFTQAGLDIPDTLVFQL